MKDKNNIAIIVQARAGSSRMPKKMLTPFSGNLTLLEVILRRVQADCPDVELILATTAEANDNAIVEIANKLCVKFFRGSQNDVLDRYIKCAENFNIDKIIRLCADNPFIDTQSILDIYNEFNHDNESDYICYITSDRIPTIKTHYGFWVEGVTLEALKRVAESTNDKLYHEHVTNYIYSSLHEFKTCYVEINKSINENRKIRLTVDTYEDFENLKSLYSELLDKSIELTPLNIVNYLDDNPKFYRRMISEIHKNCK